jgi:glycosyltransferase involved in cell wall biosynthesis
MIMDVSIIIVNYNTIPFLINAINSVFEKTEGIEYEIIVVDNNSTDNSKNILVEK